MEINLSELPYRLTNFLINGICDNTTLKEVGCELNAIKLRNIGSILHKVYRDGTNNPGTEPLIHASTIVYIVNNYFIIDLELPDDVTLSLKTSLSSCGWLIKTKLALSESPDSNDVS